MNEPLEQLIARLRADYLAEMPGRLADMESALQHWTARLPPAGPSLPTLFHRLAGSAGAYGFGDVSSLCRSTEQWLAADPSPTPENVERIRTAITAIGVAFGKPPTTGGIES